MSAPDPAPDEGSSRIPRPMVPLALAALGVVFGDIGTSPLYALRECFSGLHGIEPSHNNVLGIVSLILWTLTLVVCVKYLLVVLRADNRGEGGILALITLVGHSLKNKKGKSAGMIMGLGMIGAALLYSDSVITPAISVLSAVEGLKQVAPGLERFVVPIALGVLIALFPIQSRGTGKVGIFFGPIIALWFFTMGVLGIVSIVANPGILAALNPWYALNYFLTNGFHGFGVLGSVFLALTGAEVMYADLGHFGRRPIRMAWFALVFPGLILNYLGQGAHLLSAPGEVENLFFRLAPSWFIFPLVIIATMATVIASQAVISGAFSLARQSVQLGFWPRILVKHTSHVTIGQVYVPFINWALLLGTVGLVLAFKESGKLAAAYGIAVSIDMTITTTLILFLANRLWKIHPAILIPAGLFFLSLDLAFLSSNVAKIMSGGWVVVCIAILIITLMKTWMDGRRLLKRGIDARSIDIDTFVTSLKLNMPLRVPGIAVFMAGNPRGVPGALLHNLKHNRILHERTIVLSVRTEDVPTVSAMHRARVTDFGEGICRIELAYGFSETPDIPTMLASIEMPGFVFDPTLTTYFLGREAMVVSLARGGMLPWRKRLFAFMSHNALAATSFFRIPPNRVVELGAQTEL